MQFTFCMAAAIHAQGIGERLNNVLDIYDHRIENLEQELRFATNMCLIMGCVSLGTIFYFLFDDSINRKIDACFEKLLFYWDKLKK